MPNDDMISVLARQSDRIAELERQNEALRTLCAEVYQVVGALSTLLPGEHEPTTRVLDNLSSAAGGDPPPHAELLPYTLPGELNTNAPSVCIGFETLRRLREEGAIFLNGVGFVAADDLYASDHARFARFSPEARPVLVCGWLIGVAFTYGVVVALGTMAALRDIALWVIR